MKAKKKIIKLLRWSQKYTKTDMVYAAKGGFWIVTAKVALTLISLATMTAFANWMPQDTFGTYQFVLSVLALATILSLPGIKTSLVRSIARDKEGSLSTAFHTKFKWALVGSLGLLGVGVWYFINGNTLLAVAFLITAVLLPFVESYPVLFSYWHGKKRFDISSKYSVLVDGATAVVVIMALFLTDNLWIILFAFLSSNALFSAVLFWLTRAKVKNKEQDSEMVPFGKNLTIMSAIETAAQHLDKIILWKFLGPVQVSIYAFAILPLRRIKQLTPIQQLALPKLSERGIESDEQKRGIVRKFLVLFTLTVPFAAALALVTPFIYNLLFPQYTDSVIYFQALTIIVALMPFTLILSSLVARAKTRALYIINTVSPLLKIALFLTLAPIFGIWGVVWAIVGTEILKSAMTFYYFQKI